MPEGFSLKARHIAYSRTGHVAPFETFVLVNCLCLARTSQKRQGRGYKPRPASFVWNARKAAANPIKHDGISFDQATEAFFDPFLKLVDAGRNHESRDAVIGYDEKGRLLFVVENQWGQILRYPHDLSFLQFFKIAD
ncbi:MAG: BrnT family toxin [Methylobacter sp.]|nr:BrnT family toxin [Methylobacter sp.]